MKEESPYPATRDARRRRVFSEELKRQIVKDIELQYVTISEIQREYHVSRTAVYQWVYKYSTRRRKQVRNVVENESATHSAAHLRTRIAELEAALGRKQLQIDVLEKIVEIGSTQTGVDLKKKFGTTSSLGFELIETNTGTR